MDDSRPSTTAQTVATLRARLTDEGLVDDPYAAGMLRPPWTALHRLGGRLPERVRHNSSSAYLAARTLAFDAAVTEALDEGVEQVVVLGAGYDSRSWRLARPGVRFFEVDHPVTQADKRGRAPVVPGVDGPTFVPLDLRTGDLAEALAAAGFRPDAPAVVTAEGLTMYLERDEAVGLLATVAALTTPGSVLAVNFGVGYAAVPGTKSRRREGLTNALVRLRGEPIRFRPAPGEVPGLLAEAGWADVVVEDRPLLSRRLAGTPLALVTLTPYACVARARRPG